MSYAESNQKVSVEVASTVTPAEGEDIHKIMEGLIGEAVETWWVENGVGHIVWKKSHVHLKES